MNAHRIGSDTTVMDAIEIAKAAKLYVMFKTFCVVCVKSAANPSTIQANIKAKAKKKIEPLSNRPIEFISSGWNLTKDDHSCNEEHDGYRS